MVLMKFMTIGQRCNLDKIRSSELVYGNPHQIILKLDVGRHTTIVVFVHRFVMVV